MYIIGLAGKAGTGKDTIGGLISSLPGWHRLSFADPLRKMLVAGGFVTDEQLGDRKLKETPHPLHGASPRRLMQTLGTEWGRNMIHPCVWARLLDERLERLADSGAQGVVVTDVRFEDEAALIRDAGGRVVHVQRPDALRPANAEHVSEKGIRKRYGDITLFNDGKLEDLPKKLTVLIFEITGDIEWTFE